MNSIVRNKEILGGKPRIYNTRISVDVIASYLSNGYGVAEIKQDYPHLTTAQIMAAIDFLDKQLHKERGKLELKTT